MNHLSGFLLLIALLCLQSCSDDRPGARAGILPEKKMVQLLVETHIADGILFVDEARSEEKRDKALFYYPSIFEKHGVTKAQVDSSVVWYMKHPAAYARIYQQVIRDLEKRQAVEKKPDPAGQE